MRFVTLRGNGPSTSWIFMAVPASQVQVDGGGDVEVEGGHREDGEDGEHRIGQEHQLPEIDEDLPTADARRDLLIHDDSPPSTVERKEREQVPAPPEDVHRGQEVEIDPHLLELAADTHGTHDRHD